jgi:adenine-specific DNA-methyltransferase
MQPIDANSTQAQSADLVAENIQRLKALFPELVTEGPDGVAINVDVLKALAGDRTVTDCDEKYGLNWHGKRRARQLALTPSTGTLRPCPEESVDWDSTQNLMIEGDNLEVLKLLQKSYAGKVKLIYIDPPYNTGKDFVYPDNFQDNIKNYLELTGQTGEGGRKLSSNTEASGRFHTDWLNMMYPRLKLARNLLREDGVIFISIDDNEVDNLRLLCDEVFGEENFLATFVWQKRVSPDNDEKHVTATHDYVVCYMRTKDSYRLKGFDRSEQQDERYLNPDNDSRGPWTSSDLTRREYREHDFYEIELPSGRKVTPAAGRSWSVPPNKFKELVADKRVWFGPNGDAMPRFKRFLTDVANRVVPVTWLPSEQSGDNQGGKRQIKGLFPEVMDVFENPKPTELITSLIRMTAVPGDLILDFFAGTGTTGHAVMAQNRSSSDGFRFILVQLQEPTGKPMMSSISDITKERLRRAGKKIRAENPLFPGDLGFRVFKLASSNIRAWEPDRDNLSESLFDSIDHLKNDRTEQDILYELLLKLGLDLCVPIETRQVAGEQDLAHEIHAIGAGSLFVCLSTTIPQADVEPLASGLVAWHQALKPAGETTVVFRDSAFADDVAKTNLTAILHQHGLETVRSL